MASSARGEHEHIIPGTLYGKVPKVFLRQLPPLIPVPVPVPEPEMSATGGGEGDPSAAPAEAMMEWDTTVVTHGINWPQIDHDRRHSGWEEVEKRWAKQQQAAGLQQPPQAGAAQTNGG